MEPGLLARIHSPEDLRSFTPEELERLAAEIRERIIGTVSTNGGHLAPNLGVVELTIALHRVFRAPEDHIVWDVGHQSYPHKMLTGRADVFHTLRRYQGLSGFTSRMESSYDCFGAGHAGTAISSAMGFAIADELKGVKNHTVAVTGDGSLICGISLEALNTLRCTCKNMILVLNDNKMSISKSIGAIPNYLNQLITGRSYNRFKAFAKRFVQKIPGGSEMIGNIQNWEASAKNLFVPGIFFEELGIRYVGPINGHDLPALIQTFERVKEFNRPVIVHVITEKGHGCEYAIAAPERFHGTSAFRPETGESISASKETFSSTFGRTLVRLAEKDPRVTAVTAAMASGCGIGPDFTDRFPDRFFDVGIAEEHAAVFAAGQAAAGLRPVVAMYATFLQRALDCIFHDVCLQDLPVIFCADRAGIVEDGPTHHGVYDLAFLRAMPNLSILMPKDEKELEEMLFAAHDQDHPVVIRYPRGGSGAPEDLPHPPVVWGRSEVLRQGKDGMIFAVGREAVTAWETARILEEKFQCSVGVVNVRFLKPFDEDLLRKYGAEMPVFTLEDHVMTGGLASIAAEVLCGSDKCRLRSFGWKADVPADHGSTAALRENAGLTPGQLAEMIATELHREVQK